MNYGGRILEIDARDGSVRAHCRTSRSASWPTVDCTWRWATTPTLADLRRFTDRMADLTLELIEGTASPLAQQLYLTPPSPVSGKGSILMFSGGIGHYYYTPLAIASVADATLHGDVGPLLAESLRTHPAMQAYTVERPAETLRATVLGAGTQTVTLSGSTIWAEREVLPIRNAPVVRPAHHAGHDGR